MVAITPFFIRSLMMSTGVSPILSARSLTDRAAGTSIEVGRGAGAGRAGASCAGPRRAPGPRRPAPPPRRLPPLLNVVAIFISPAALVAARRTESPPPVVGLLASHRGAARSARPRRYSRRYLLFGKLLTSIVEK